jgi:hypothetical protein
MNADDTDREIELQIVEIEKQINHGDWGKWRKRELAILKRRTRVEKCQ